MAVEITGRFLQELEMQSGTSSRTGNPWHKRQWVFETEINSQYPKKLMVQCFGDRSDSFKFEPNKDYRLRCDVESREFNGRWFTDVNVFAADPIEGGMGTPAPAPAFGAAPAAPAPAFGAAPAAPFEPAGDNSDDLPF